MNDREQERQRIRAKLSKQDRDIISCWVDLLVPYCGDYYEANSWDEKGVKKYDRFANKRKIMQDMQKEEKSEI